MKIRMHHITHKHSNGGPRHRDNARFTEAFSKKGRADQVMVVRNKFTKEPVDLEVRIMQTYLCNKQLCLKAVKLIIVR